MTHPNPYILVIAGSDPSGSAGIQADLKTITAHGLYAATVITTLTVGNSYGVSAVESVPANFVLAQLRAVLCDFGPGIVKTGVLPDAETIAGVKTALNEVPPLALVADPVLVTKTGERLADESAISAWRKFLPHVTLLVPSASEASLLTSLPVSTVVEAEQAARQLCGLGAQAVLIKGRELQDEPDRITDVLCTGEGYIRLYAPRLPTQAHGTGDTLASAIAANLARGIALENAIKYAQTYVRNLLAHAIPRGAGLPVLAHEASINLR
jgi:hydroxymethylpyrimidine kinase/phosphomethylpyrimidine kinase